MRSHLLLTAIVVVLACASSARAQTVLQPDAAPPGASLVVSLIAANGGWTGSEVITTTCPGIIVGPRWLSAGAGDPASPIPNAVLSTVFFVLENATPGNCTVRVNGTPLTATGAIDNVFSVVLPLPNPTDGGATDTTPAGDNVIRIASSARSDGGVVVFQSLNVPAGVRLEFAKTDPVPATGGNEAYMPIIVLVRGDAVVNGTIDISGEVGRDFGDNRLARSKNGQTGLDGGDGGHGGPGGGGGAAGGPHNSTTGSGSGGYAGTGGDGFGGGSGSPSIVFDRAPGGAGVAFPPTDVTGGNSPFNRGGGRPADGVTNGGGGGSGNPFGIGGQGGRSDGNGGAAGFGGGGGANTSNSTLSGGGGGGFASAGTPGGNGQTCGGRGGGANGLPSLVPLMGGSGGGGGDGWITGGGPFSGSFGGGGGGGGGGGLELVVYGTLSGSGAIRARGGDGGDAGPGNSAASAGGGGSGGAIFFAARDFRFTGSLDVHGGVGGVNSAFPNPGGHGGEGRVRYDGRTPPALTNGPTAAPGSLWQGCAATSVNDVIVTTASATPCSYVVLNAANAVVASGTLAANGSLDLTTTFDAHGDLTVVFARDNVPSPVGIARVVADTDGDDIPDFADADDDDDGIPDAAEPAHGVLDLDSDDDGVPDVIEAYGAAFDLDRDGHPDNRTDSDFDGLVDVTDANPNNPTVITAFAPPRASDSDGSPDFLDLDSDGDGWFDLVEAGGNEADGDGVIDLLVDFDDDGLATLVDPDEDGNPWPLTDSDGDGVEDRVQVCGDARTSSGEACDLGAANGDDCRCSLTCRRPDGNVACDDGDFCSATDRCNGAGSCVGSGETCTGETPLCDRDNARCLTCIFRPGIVDGCDGVDADCDGETDEDFAPILTRCGVGRCGANTGTTACDGVAGVSDDCDGLAGAIPEVCNAIDDDCDGATDDGAGCPALETQITAAPDSLTADTESMFTFVNALAPPGFDTFECILDSGAWTPCDGTFDTGELADGSHLFLVRAVSPNGEVDPSPAYHVWTIDTAPPDTTILVGPPALATMHIAELAFEGGASYQCVLDGGPVSDCDAHTTLTVADGAHTLSVSAVSRTGILDPTPATWTWTVDTSVPDTRIVTAPASLTAASTATFTFDDPTATADTFQCRRESGAWLVCASPFVFSVTAGTHTLAVRGVGGNGLSDPTPALHTWVVDPAVPETVIALAPPAQSASSDADFAFTGGATYECVLDGVVFASCAATVRYADLADGPHTLRVRAISRTGVVDPTPATWTWTIDTSVPDTRIVSAPAALTASTSATFTFDDPTATAASFECRLDAASWSACASPLTLTLTGGAHTFAVRGVGANGLADPTPAARTWTVDASEPDTTIVLGPEPLVSSDVATFVFSGGVDYECALDGPVWTPCDELATFGDLDDGEHTLSVRAVSTTGVVDATPASWTWTVDSDVPETEITEAPASLTASLTATFMFNDPSEPGRATFECRLDAGAWAVCLPPVVTDPLAPGLHTLLVRAVGDNGVSDPTPAVHTWLIDPNVPDTVIVDGPDALSSSAAAAFTFAGGVTYECGLDVDTWTPCEGFTTYAGLADGEHTLNVRALGALGTADPTPAVFTWVVDARVPDTRITGAPDAVTAATQTSITFVDPTDALRLLFECRLDNAAWSACQTPFIAEVAAGAHTFAVRAVAATGVADPTPATHTWLVDPAVPDTIITLGPAPLVSVAQATFAFAGGARYECTLDDGELAACPALQSYAALTDGEHVLTVRAISATGVADPTPAVHTWVIDTRVPDTTLTDAPDAITAATAATFVFVDPTATADTFECRLDGAAWATCASPLVTDPLLAGSHTLLVRAVGDNGLVDPTPAFHAWTIDPSVPATIIAVGPTDPSQSSDATLVLSGGATYECALDTGEWVACDAVVSYSGLDDGEHSFMARAISATGVVDPTPASWSWTIDTSLPETVIVSGPPALTNLSVATFTFAVPGEPTHDTFRCRLDAGAWSDCDGSTSYTGLGDGLHHFEAAAVDAHGNVDPTPAVHLWTIDRTAPDTSIVAGPEAVTQSDFATFALAANEPGATFECALDPLPPIVWAPCEAFVNVDSLTGGAHVFSARATDAAGNVDPSPASRSWSIDLTAPETAIVDGPEGPLASDETATFTFEDPVTPARTSFECRVDAASWGPCDGGEAHLDALAVGVHVFTVRACDGDVCDPTPAVATFTVSASSCPRDALAPAITCAPDVHAECGDVLDPQAFAATATDDCGATVVAEGPETIVLGEPALFVYVATDGNGNVASCLTRVYVDDSEAPTIVCPEAATVVASATCDAQFAPFPSPQANDGCDEAPAILGNAPARFALGTTTVTYVATDARGNRASCTMDVTVADLTEPTLTCPATVTQDAAADACGWEGTVDAALSDNCTAAAVLDETKDFPVGTTTLTFESEAATCTSVVTVRDVTAPVVSCDPTPSSSAAVALVGGQAEDACGVTLAIEDVSCTGADCLAETRGAAVFATSVIGVPVTVAYTVVAIDPSGNRASVDCSFALDAAPDPVVTVSAQGSGGCGAGGAGPWSALGLLVALLVSARVRARS